MSREIKRICACTRIKKDRSTMFRIAKINEEIVLDLSQGLQGRGCYLSKDKDVILLAKKKNVLAKSLKCKVDLSFYDKLIELL